MNNEDKFDSQDIELNKILNKLEFNSLTIFALRLTRFISILFSPTVILIPFTTLLTGLIFAIPIIGMLALTLASVIWLIFFYGPMIILSLIWSKIPILGFLLIPIGVPLSVIANLYCGFIADMGEREQKLMKLSICDNWIFSIQMYKLIVNEGIHWSVVDTTINNMVFKKWV